LALLGDGAFGYVFAAKLRHSTAYDAEVAVKFIDKASVPSRSWVNDDQYGYIPFEAHFLKQINHPNIIRFLDLYTDSKYVYLVTDLHGTEWRSDNPLLNPIQNSGLRNVHGVQSAGKSALMATQDFSRLSDDELLERKRTACDLFECIDAHQRMPEDTVKFIFAQILDAVCYLADLGFVHRDLKDEVIFDHIMCKT
jgi:serine/threonine protein kinase